MLIDVHGPNLPSKEQRVGYFHAHAHGCRDSKRLAKTMSETPYAFEADSVEAVALMIYGDSIAQGEMTVDDAVADIHFCPCTKALPNSERSS